MRLPHATPDPSGTERAAAAKCFRDLATENARLRPHALTHANGEEDDHGPKYPANFTKGLLHDQYGLLCEAVDYRAFVEAINSHDRHLFETAVYSAPERQAATSELVQPWHCKLDGDDPSWRGWESPRAGHVFELEGPDAGSVGMAPAPRVGSSELAAELAEVYGLALLRDVPFTKICEGGDDQLCGEDPAAGKSVLTAAEVVKALNSMPFYSGKKVVSSSPLCEGLDRYERNRRWARTLSSEGKLTPESAFRGSTKGAHEGPYVSQFLLVGTPSLAGPGGGASSFPGKDAAFDLQDGFVGYGSLTIDQRTLTHKNCLDHMTDWQSWLDVQNGANLKGRDVFEPKRRFITTPRDLATYVHFDALYEAYLNATLVLLGLGVPASKGFAEPSPTRKRDAFATFGGPHVLSLVTEVATRCLKAVRRQKFNYHRRARPETLAGRVALVDAGHADELTGAGGCTGVRDAFVALYEELPKPLRKAVKEHNALQNAAAMRAMRRIECLDPPVDVPAGIGADPLLLPMAFPEGSPMHPAYGAGHATVAGGCVTMVKAFFEMFEDCDGRRLRELRTPGGDPIAYVPDDTGKKLVKDPRTKGALTVQGELDKLAANISIGRNMAGVHYYSDYYDSLRMGERIAVGILLEQAPTYGDAIETSFHGFDGDLVSIRGDAGESPSLRILDRDGNPVPASAWWLRHVGGEEQVLDL